LLSDCPKNMNKEFQEVTAEEPEVLFIGHTKVEEMEGMSGTTDENPTKHARMSATTDANPTKHGRMRATTDGHATTNTRMSAATDGNPTNNTRMSATDGNLTKNARMNASTDGSPTATRAGPPRRPPSLDKTTKEEGLTKEIYEIRTIQGEACEKTSGAG
jgi:hypothetical protein